MIHPLLEAAHDVPFEGQGLWQWFWELNSERGNTGFGLLPITKVEIEQWARLSGVDLSTWELATLRAMDQSLLTTHAELVKERATDRK